jgi:hypothetical protein
MPGWHWSWLVAAVAKLNDGLELKGDLGAVSGYNDFFAQNLKFVIT